MGFVTPIWIFQDLIIYINDAKSPCRFQNHGLVFRCKLSMTWEVPHNFNLLDPSNAKVMRNTLRKGLSLKIK